jgi:hypothetical protein
MVRSAIFTTGRATGNMDRLGVSNEGNTLVVAVSKSFSRTRTLPDRPPPWSRARRAGANDDSVIHGVTLPSSSFRYRTRVEFHGGGGSVYWSRPFVSPLSAVHRSPLLRSGLLTAGGAAVTADRGLLAARHLDERARLQQAHGAAAAWRTLRFTASACVTLWFLVTLAGGALLNVG